MLNELKYAINFILRRHGHELNNGSVLWNIY